MVSQKEIVEVLREPFGVSSDIRIEILARIEREGISPPEGYALVPIEPTVEMFNAAEETGFHSYTGTFVLEPVSVYKAMINAAKNKP